MFLLFQIDQICELFALPQDPAMLFGIGVPAFATESGSGIVRCRSSLPASDVEKERYLFGCPERPAHQVNPPLGTRRLAGSATS